MKKLNSFCGCQKQNLFEISEEFEIKSKDTWLKIYSSLFEMLLFYIKINQCWGIDAEINRYKSGVILNEIDEIDMGDKNIGMELERLNETQLSFNLIENSQDSLTQRPKSILANLSGKVYNLINQNFRKRRHR